MNETLLLDQRTRTLVKDYTPKDEHLKRLGCFFSVFSDVTRLKIISALCVADMCVTDISRVLEINQTTVSHQLKILRDIRLVRTKRQGKIVFYYIDSEEVDKIMLCGVDFLHL